MLDQVSWHWRGPAHIKQFAVYYPSGTATKAKMAKRSPHERRHDHAEFHKREKEILERVAEAEKKGTAEKRALGDLVVATINGQVVSWLNDYDGKGGSPPAATAAPEVAAASVPGSNKAPFVPSAVPAGDWGRAGYYNSDSKVADGLVFLNNMGGQGSGVFD